MSNENQTPQRPDWDEIVQDIRQDPNLKPELERQQGRQRWRPREMPIGMPPWTFRILVAVLVLALLFEIVVLVPTAFNATGISEKANTPGTANRSAPAEVIFDGSLPTPTIAPPPPTATTSPPDLNNEPVVIDKSF